jgi:hypothetical protein
MQEIFSCDISHLNFFSFSTKDHSSSPSRCKKIYFLVIKGDSLFLITSLEIFFPCNVSHKDFLRVTHHVALSFSFCDKDLSSLIESQKDLSFVGVLHEFYLHSIHNIAQN